MLVDMIFFVLSQVQCTSLFSERKLQIHIFRTSFFIISKTHIRKPSKSYAHLKTFVHNKQLNTLLRVQKHIPITQCFGFGFENSVTGDKMEEQHNSYNNLTLTWHTSCSEP
ncbi:hypothetical protein ABFS83_12G006800 [Erythranthe nasuta]